MRRQSILLRVHAASLIVLFACLLVAAPKQVFATVITAFPVDFSAAEASQFNGAVATFTDDNPSATPADFNASIDWGDGSTPTAGSIASSSAAFVVLGQHTYADEGSFTVTVTINDNPPGTGTATATDTASITESDALSGTPTTFSVPAGVALTNVFVGTFKDTLTSNVASDFTATIDWGDATVTAGTVLGGSGAFQVNGTHTYAAPGTFSVVVTLSDDAPGTATATVTSTAHVAATGLSATAINFSTKEGASFNGTVATFSDSNTSASFTATINWGDGTNTSGTIAGTSGSYYIAGQHTYADEGSFTFTVTVSDGAATSMSSGTATVAEADALSGTPVTFSPQFRVPFTGVVANFTNTYTANVAGDFSATIDWGDGTAATNGTVSGGSGSFQVIGTHTYTASGPFAVTVTLSDDAPGTAKAIVTSIAQVAAGLSATAINISPSEGASFSGFVANFFDSDTSKTSASFTTTINWGDGTTSAGTIAGGSGSFTLSGQHTYADEGSFTLSVTVSENAPGTATSTSSATATVAEADALSGTPVIFNSVAGTPFTGVVANFSNTNTTNAASDFTATIDWGDGTAVATGTVTGSGGAFQVSGTHTYAAPGTFSVAVTLSDDAPGTAATTVTSTATAVNPPVVPTPALRWYGLLFLGLLMGLLGLVAAGKNH